MATLDQKIINKIEKEFQSGINEECQIVFILSKMRKILEINNQKSKYKYINFYCNWVVHSILDRPNTVKIIKNLFDKSIDFSKDARENAKIFKQINKEFFNLLILKNDIIGFFKEYNIKVDLLKNHWNSFRIKLLDILVECPIIFQGNNLQKIELKQYKKTEYSFKFCLLGIKGKPIIKLKFK